MSRLISGNGVSGDGQGDRVPTVKPDAAALPDQTLSNHPMPKRRPSKTRQQAWAKIDGGKGTWKPK